MKTNLETRFGDPQAHRDHLRETYRITDAWRDLGFDGTPAKSCRCPWREDRKPSFSVFDEGRSFKDFSTDEAGDVFSFVMRALDLPFKEAAQWIEGRTGTGPRVETPRPTTILRPHPPKEKKPLKLPALDRGTRDDLEQVARTRGLQSYAVEIAVRVGTLRFGRVCGERSWILTDASGKLAEARRLDGKPFETVGSLSARKAHTLAGSSKSWPCGLTLSEDPPNHSPTVLLVEGGPDYLAALDFLVRFKAQGFRPVAMLGKSNGISSEALDLMAGRRVRIYPHHDPGEGGMGAAHQWAEQLAGVGCKVDGFSFAGLTMSDGQPVTDLNDILFADEESRKAWKGLLP